jgi:PKD domain
MQLRHCLNFGLIILESIRQRNDRNENVGGNIMVKSILALLALVLIGVWMIGCSSDGPASPDGGTANRAPGTPTIDTEAGAPANGSTDKVISSLLHWQCSDPDGDDLTFDVFFGTATDPPSVATGQTPESYNPGALANSTTYYWKIVAEDPDEETASSAVWSFTTMALVAETVSTPTAPTGPATGTAAESLSYSTGGATNSAGHSVQYRFDWGGGDYSVWSAGTTVSHTWASAGTHNVKAQARCATHPGTVSAWSTGYDVVISAATETVSPPDTPTGPATGDTADNQGFSRGGATSSEGHTVEYRFDWDDGDFSSWTTSTTVYHRFDTPDTYEVKAQARCRDHTTVESAWSGALTVVISAAAEVVSQPPAGWGPVTGYIGDTQTYTMSHGVNTTLGHEVEYQFDWDDGSYSDWSASLSASHAWTTAGVYFITVTARCAVHTTILSNPSIALNVVITDAAETVSAPTRMSRERSIVTIDTDIWYSASGSISSYGHDLEYRFDWGDGSISDWGAAPGEWIDHSWSEYGSYSVKAQARCIADTPVVSDWATVLNDLIVRESITVPTTPTGPGSGILGAILTFNAGGSTSSDGHALEYRLRIYISGQTTYSDWSATGVIEHVFARTGQHDVRAQARCIEHPDATSNSSDRLYVTISDP